jgi:hypothetical protein
VTIVYVQLPIAEALPLVGGTMPEMVTIAGTNMYISGYAFDAAAREDLAWSLPAVLYGSGNVSVTVQWESRAGSTTGAAIWGARIAATTPGDAVSIEAKGWASASTSTTTVNATAKGLNATTVTVSNLDSLSGFDKLDINIYRDAAAGGDTMAGDAVLTAVYLAYSDT